MHQHRVEPEPRERGGVLESACPIRAAWTGAAWGAAVLVVGCAGAPPLEELPLNAVAPMSSTEGAPRQDPWWKAFGDPLLDAHVARGLGSNFDLDAAFRRLESARAVAAQAAAPRSPALDLAGGASAQEGNTFAPTSEINLGFQAAYEVDLWGRIRADVDAAELEAAATEEDYQAAAVSLSAQITTTVYRLTESRAQLALIDSQLATNRSVLEVLEARFAIGQTSSVDVLRQRQLVEATSEQRIIEAQGAEVLEHQLALLQGDPPQGDLQLTPPVTLPTVPELPEVGLPAELTRRRPDVRAAFARLASADASLASAARDRYPRLSFSASLSTSTRNDADLFDEVIESLAAQLVGPLIDGGRRRREVDRTLAVRRQRLAEYGTAVVTAFGEVEDALAQERHQAERITNLEGQLELTSLAYTQLRNQYFNGAADFIDVLVALSNQQALERSLLEARLLLVEYRVGLHRAIAGGFLDPNAARIADPDRNPTENS